MDWENEIKLAVSGQPPQEIKAEDNEALASIRALSVQLQTERANVAASRTAFDSVKDERAALQFDLKKVQNDYKIVHASLMKEQSDHNVLKQTLNKVLAARDKFSSLVDSLRKWKSYYTQLLHSLQPLAEYPIDYDYAAEHENNIIRSRDQCQLDKVHECEELKLERDSLKIECDSLKGLSELRQRMLDKGVDPKDIAELEKGQ